MAKKARGGTASLSGKWPWILLALAALAGLVVLVWGKTITGYARTGTSYGAHVACSCRFIGGRPIGDCEKDFEPGMEFVFLSEDESDRSVTAYIPLVASQTATYREGAGCVLEEWHG